MPDLSAPIQASSRGRSFAYAMLLIVPCLWAANSLVARMAPGRIEPHTLAFLRWCIAGVLFALPVRKELFAQRRYILSATKRYLVLGALGMWICGAWVYLAGRTTSAVNISLIYTVSPVMIALMAATWLKERVGAMQMIGIALALLGVVHVTIQGHWTSIADVTWVAGDAWILAAAVSWAVFSVLLRRWSGPLSDRAHLAVISAAGCIVLAPFVVMEIASSSGPVISVAGIGLVLVAAVASGYGAFLLNALIQRELGTARAGLMIYLAPLYSAAMSWILLGERLHAYHAWGAVAVLGGIYLVSRR